MSQDPYWHRELIDTSFYNHSYYDRNQARLSTFWDFSVYLLYYFVLTSCLSNRTWKEEEEYERAIDKEKNEWRQCPLNSEEAKCLWEPQTHLLLGHQSWIILQGLDIQGPQLSQISWNISRWQLYESVWKILVTSPFPKINVEHWVPGFEMPLIVLTATQMARRYTCQILSSSLDFPLPGSFWRLFSGPTVWINLTPMHYSNGLTGNLKRRHSSNQWTAWRSCFRWRSFCSPIHLMLKSRSSKLLITMPMRKDEALKGLCKLLIHKLFDRWTPYKCWFQWE